MNVTRAPWVALAVLAGLACPVPADDLAAPLPGPAEIKILEAYPARIDLKGSHDARQIVLTAMLADNRSRDLSGDARYTLSDPKVARISAGGRVVALADGVSEIVAEFGGHRCRIPLTVESAGVDMPVNFPNQVVPIFTKLGCNAGNCHGKLSGQNGFRLSLLGFEPGLDYDTLVNEDRGRRVFAAAPDRSLVLLKPTGQVPHGGGKRLEMDSDEYRVIRRWIAAGAPMGPADAAVVTRLSIHPGRRIMGRRDRQQIAVIAESSDGTREDVTRRAQYESNDPDVAGVDAEGLVRTHDPSGEAAVMVRYQGQVAVFRATVPLGVEVPDYGFPEATVVDRHTHAKWRELGLVPSDLCTDAQFIRRAMLDLTGTLPTPARVLAFVADASPDKRARLVDQLLDSGEYADAFAHKWADILRVSRKNQPARVYGTFAFHGWIREAMAADKPYDEFAREILCALGDETKTPTAVWYKDLLQPEQLVDDMTQVFLGLRVACAQCHHHPYETWGQDDYWGLAAFFGRVRRRPSVQPGMVVVQNGRDQRQAISIAPAGSVINKRTNRPTFMKTLDGPAVDVPPGDDPRQALVDWMVEPRNPYFARAVANRYWAHFFGRGIVDPLDDIRLTNPPTNPYLLDALADDLVSHGYSLKHLVRTICTSRTYQLSSTPNEFNARDRHSYARYYPRRLDAEVIFDAVSQVIGGPSGFDGLPRDTHAPRRAVMLPDESFQSYFLDVFGRPQRISACECERVGEANLAQVLHLLNSDEVQGRISAPNARADQMAKDPRPDAEKVEELFLSALARKPTPAQQKAALDHIAKNDRGAKVAYENIIWTLINTKEFSFNQ